MKKRKWMLSVLALALALALSVTACGASSGASSSAVAAPAMAEEAGMAQKNVAYADEARGEAAESPTSAASPDAGFGANGGSIPVTTDPTRKMIRRVYLNMHTKEYDKLVSALVQQVAQLGGYIEQSSQSGDGGYQNPEPYPASAVHGVRSATVIARVPSDQVDVLIASLGEHGSIRSREETMEDVTLQYVDVESHKKSLLVEQERLFELMKTAEKLEDIIALEARMSEVRYQLESYESQLRTFDNQISYSTVSISVAEVERIVPIEEKTVWSRISTGFGNTMYQLGVGAQNLFIWVLVSSPYLVVWAVILAALVIVLRRVLRKHKSTNKQKPQA